MIDDGIIKDSAGTASVELHLRCSDGTTKICLIDQDDFVRVSAFKWTRWLCTCKYSTEQWY